jgi:hypothetical protein
VVPLQQPVDATEPSAEEQQRVAGIIAEADDPGYWFHASRDGSREAHYRGKPSGCWWRFPVFNTILRKTVQWYCHRCAHWQAAGAVHLDTAAAALLSDRLIVPDGEHGDLKSSQSNTSADPAVCWRLRSAGGALGSTLAHDLACFKPGAQQHPESYSSQLAG